MSEAITVRNRTEPSAPVPHAIAGVSGQLPEVLQLCNAIASAGDLIPVAYRGKPGAVLLAKMWGDKHDVDIFTAVQNIDVIDGKPWVKTQMRIELAVARGFEFKVTETTTELCTVEVWNHSGGVPKRIGDPITARFDDRPRNLKYKSGKPTPWALHPDDMLFAEACRKADRRYVRTAAGMIDAEQDYDEPEADPLDIIDGQHPHEVPAEFDDEFDDEPPDAEIVDDDEPEPSITEEELRKAAKVGDLLRAASKLGAGGVALVADIVQDQDLARAVLAEVTA